MSIFNEKELKFDNVFVDISKLSKKGTDISLLPSIYDRNDI
jgi:hypothetical protein